MATASTRNYANHYSGNFAEAAAYLGIVLVVVLAYFLWKEWSDRLVRLPLIVAGACAVLSLGPRLHVGG